MITNISVDERIVLIRFGQMQATEIRMRGDFEEREAKKIKELREDFERRAQARSAQSNEDRRRSHLEPSPRQRPEGLSQEEG